MTTEEKKTKVDPLSEVKNWEQRLRTEQEAPKKWNETWGSLFENEVPLENSKKKEYLQKKLKETPKTQVLPKYGVGAAFKEFGTKDFRRKKMFRDDIDVDSD